MPDQALNEYKHRNIENQILRLGNLLNVIVQLLPEASEPSEYGDEILAVLFAAQDLTNQIHRQVSDKEHHGSGLEYVSFSDTNNILNQKTPNTPKVRSAATGAP